MRLPWVDLCCSSQRWPGAWFYEMICAVGVGVASPFHLTQSRAQYPLPAARHTLFPLSLYCFEPRRWSWLHKSGGNATLPLDYASCRGPSPANLYIFLHPFSLHNNTHTCRLYPGLAIISHCLSVCRKDDKDYALKQIEGTGISMSACREIAVRSVPGCLCLLCSTQWLTYNVTFTFTV